MKLKKTILGLAVVAVAGVNAWLANDVNARNNVLSMLNVENVAEGAEWWDNLKEWASETWDSVTHWDCQSTTCGVYLTGQPIYGTTAVLNANGGRELCSCWYLSSSSIF